MSSGLTTVTELHEVISLEIVPNHQQNSSILLPLPPKLFLEIIFIFGNNFLLNLTSFKN